MSGKAKNPPFYGLLAEFRQPENLIAAVKALRADGYRRVEGYTPYPVPGLAEALDFRPTSVPAIFLAGALAGGFGGYFMQWYAAVISYPINIGGRPLHSWPSFIPITFESTVLSGVLCGALGMILLNRLPRYHHPISNVARFRAATSDGFFACIESNDSRFDTGRTADFLHRLGAVTVTLIPGS